jgi:hypothetical protein
MIFGLKFSGLTAWWLWRTIYLAKLPGLLKKLRVTMSWTLDLFFGRDIEQIITLRDVEALSDRLALAQRNRFSLDDYSQPGAAKQLSDLERKKATVTVG